MLTEGMSIAEKKHVMTEVLIRTVRIPYKRLYILNYSGDTVEVKPGFKSSGAKIIQN